MGKLFKILLIVAVVGAVLVALYAFVAGPKGNKNGITLVEIAKGSITEKALAVGQIEPRIKFSVKSKIPGLVSKCFVEVGDTVKTGDPLFEIAPDPTPSERSDVDRTVERGRATFERAKAELERFQALAKDGIVTGDDLDRKREQFELARVALAQAQDTRELTLKGRVSGRGANFESVIRAPADGTVLSRSANVGDPVVPLTSFQPGTELAAIAEMGDLIFKGTVDEIDVGKMAIALPTRIKVGALPSDIVTGKVSRIAPQAQKQEGATVFNVEIELDPSQKVTLRAGYSANADVIIREKKDVTVVPERLVIFEEGGKKTSVEIPGASPKDEPKKIAVKLGLSDGLNVEVTEGLKPGDKVVQRPPKEIK